MSDVSTAKSDTYAPYHNPSVGELIIQTSDGVNFYVSKYNLALASTFFAAKFPPPHPPPPSLTIAPDTNRALVFTTDDSDLWEKLLPLVYVSLERDIASTDIGMLLAAAQRYNMVGITHILGQMLTRADMMEEPLRVYAVACAFGFPEAARVAARRSLRLPACLGFASELQYASAAAYHRLLDYRRRCALAVRALLVWEGPERAREPAWIMAGKCSGLGNAAHIIRGRDCLHRTLGRQIVSLILLLLPSTSVMLSGAGIWTPLAWRESMENVVKTVEQRPDLTPTFSPVLLEPLMKACAAGDAVLNSPADVVSKAHAFSEVLDKYILDAISKVCSSC